MIYIIILVIFALPVVIYDVWHYDKGAKAWLVFEFIVLVLLAGLRYRVGGDTLVYILFFEEYPTLAELPYFDFVDAEFNPFWYVFNAIAKSIFDDFTTFQILHALVVNAVFLWFFRKYAKNFFSAVLLYAFAYYFSFNTEVLRESLAICCFLLAYPFLCKKNYIVYYLICSAGVLFHYSAFFTFIIPFVMPVLKNFKVKHIIITGIVLGVLLTSINFMPFVIDFFSFNDSLYLKIDYYGTSEATLMNVLFHYVNVIPIILLLFFYTIVDKNHTELKLLHIQNFVILYCILLIFSGFYQVVFARPRNYLIPFMVTYIVDTVAYLNNVYKKTVYSLVVKTILVMILVLNSYYYWSDINHDGNRFYKFFIPYHSVLDPQIDEEREEFFLILRDD